MYLWAPRVARRMEAGTGFAENRIIPIAGRWRNA
jgi:hypothetical protein